MASSALKAHLHTSRKIVNDSHTFFLGDFPDLCCDCCLQFTNCLRIVLVHIILEIHTHYPWDTPTDKIWGGGVQVQVQAHSISHLLLISLSLNRSLSQARASFVVWGVAPSLPEPLFISIYTSASSQWCPKLHQYHHIAHSLDLNPPDFYL
jgi:hypothetical protein